MEGKRKHDTEQQKTDKQLPDGGMQHKEEKPRHDDMRKDNTQRQDS